MCSRLAVAVTVMRISVVSATIANFIVPNTVIYFRFPIVLAVAMDYAIFAFHEVLHYNRQPYTCYKIPSRMSLGQMAPIISK